MAERTEIASEITALAVHCRPPIMEVDQRATWVRDWCNDLGPFPLDAVRAACSEWRLSGATKFPTPGQLLPLVRKRIEVPAQNAPPQNAAWAELSDDDYAALPLRAKVRHHRVLAMNAERQAHREAALQGWDRNTANAPPIYHQHMAKADNHRREVEALRSILRRQPMAAE